MREEELVGGGQHPPGRPGLQDFHRGPSSTIRMASLVCAKADGDQSAMQPNAQSSAVRLPTVIRGLNSTIVIIF